jgi:hypothetical protein
MNRLPESPRDLDMEVRADPVPFLPRRARLTGIQHLFDRSKIRFNFRGRQRLPDRPYHPHVTGDAYCRGDRRRGDRCAPAVLACKPDGGGTVTALSDDARITTISGRAIGIRGVSAGMQCIQATTEVIAAIQHLNETEPQASFTLDPAKLRLSAAQDALPVKLAEGQRRQFFEGTWDPTAVLLEAGDAIAQILVQLYPTKIERLSD